MLVRDRFRRDGEFALHIAAFGVSLLSIEVHPGLREGWVMVMGVGVDIRWWRRRNA